MRKKERKSGRERRRESGERKIMKESREFRSEGKK